MRSTLAILLATALSATLLGCSVTHQSESFQTKELRQARDHPAANLETPRMMERMAHTAEAEDVAGNLEVHFINVGQGDSTLVKCPDGETILVDCGSTGHFDEGYVRGYLREHLDPDSPRIDLLVITHPDRDHYNKIVKVTNGNIFGPKIEVGRVALVGNTSEYSSERVNDFLDTFPSDRFEDMEATDYNVGPPVRDIDICGDTVVSVLAAGVSESGSSVSPTNTRGIVVLVRYGDFDVLLTGDATRVTQRNILDRFANDLGELEAVEVLKVSHHGSRATSMMDPNDRNAWLETIQPDIAIFSASGTNGFGHPSVKLAKVLKPFTFEVEPHDLILWDGAHNKSSASTIAQYEGESMFLTATNGTIVVESDGTDYWWSWGT